MFSHLCRACMLELDHLDPTQTVPLFEPYQDLFLSQICMAMNLSVDEADNLGRSVCRKCAETIMEFYTFQLMFTKSNRKLVKMLNYSIGSKKKVPFETKHEVDELNLSHAESIVQTNFGTIDSKHQCQKCSAGFNSRKLLRSHVNEVHRRDANAEHRWVCSCCRSRFRTRDLKNLHQRECRQLNASGGLVEMIDVKESEFIDYNDFDTGDINSGSETDELLHRESKYNPSAGEKWKCKHCSASFESLEQLHQHENSQHMESDSKFFANVSIKQEQVDVDIADVKTERESQELIDSLAIAQPQRQQHSDFRWKCKTCNEIFETRELLRIHRRSHSGPRKLPQTIRTGWTCNICDAILPSRDKVRLHKNINHPNEKRERRRNDEIKNWGDVGEYECELCSKAFVSKSKIRKHMDVHKNKGRPKRLCTICGLELCSTYNLNNHIRTVHGRERKFHCTLCDRRFSHSHHLKTHMNRHEGIRPFQCDQCVKSFFDKTTLREHVKSVHLNLKAYACKICTRTFNRSGNMRAHMSKTHHLGDIADANRSFGNRHSDHEPSADDTEDFTPRQFTLAEPFRSMIIKSSN